MQGEDNEAQHDYSKPHRDNHYMLLLSTQGQFKLNLDFEDIEINGPALLLIYPEQVHHIINVYEPQGWAISFDSSLMDKELQLIFEKDFNEPLSLNPESFFYQQASAVMKLLENMQLNLSDTIYSSRAKNSLLDALLSLVAGHITAFSTARKSKTSRGAIIEQAFKQLLRKHYKTWKQPALYAAELHITVAHLYDTVKEITGNSVSAMIQDYSILEAKRLLWFTKLSVKEIGYELGYDEPVYFGKLFKKATGLTPLKFRQQYQG